MNNLEKAKEMLKNSDYTCIICSDEETLTSHKRGVAPLLAWIDEGKQLNGYSVADKVIGNGAAFLYVLLDVDELYTDVISKSALKTLTRYNIPVTYDIVTEFIRNRNNTGFCPIESAVAEITSPETALETIRNRLKEMGTV